MRSFLALGALLLLSNCRSISDTGVAPFEASDKPAPIRVRDCEGPATSLPEAIVATLPSRNGTSIDHVYATLATEVPGGFAGVLFDDGQPVLLLTRPDEAAAAKAALAGKLSSFPIASAQVRQARWDFGQIFDWFNYLMTQPSVHSVGFLSADKDEAANRVAFGVRDEETRMRLAKVLAALDIPCDLVLIRIVEPMVLTL